MERAPAKKMIIRLRSKDLLERVEADSSWTIGQLKLEIMKKTNVPVADQVLALDPKLTNMLKDSERLSAFPNGQMLHFSYTTDRNIPDPTVVEPKKYSLKSYMDHLESQGLIFTHQKDAHCRECALDFEAANVFQAYVQSFAFQRQRVGYLYGKYAPTGGVLVEAIYEPPQESRQDGFTLHEKEPEVERADTLATLLGLEFVGWVFSHDKRDYNFSAKEVMKMAELQYKALARNPEKGKAFVTLKLTLNEEGQSQLESFQVSDQALKLHEKNMFAPPVEKEPKFVRTKEKVLMHTEKGGRIDSDSLDTDILLTMVPLAPGKGCFHTVFPPANRPESPHTEDTLRRYLTDTKSRPWVQQLADFHFLLFISNFLSMSSDMPPICESVKNNDPSKADNFKFLIHSYAGLQ